MSSQRAGLIIAVATIMVQAPRLTLAMLAADRLPVDAATERELLVLAGVGTALVLTGGNLYLAHTVARVEAWRRTLAATWLAVLAASGGLVLPLIVAGLSARTLPEILGASRLEWPWAVLASIAHELTAAGCVLASAAWAARTGAAGAGAAGTTAPLIGAAGTVPATSEDRLPAAGAAGGAGWRLQAAAGGTAGQRVACRAGCGRSFVSRQAEIAHQRALPPAAGTVRAGACELTAGRVPALAIGEPARCRQTRTVRLRQRRVPERPGLAVPAPLPARQPGAAGTAIASLPAEGSGAGTSGARQPAWRPGALGCRGLVPCSDASCRQARLVLVPQYPPPTRQLRTGAAGR
jgi:hypothetical protein